MRDGWYELAAGDRVAGYEIVRPIGRGASGSVYEARHGAAAVALKVMHEHDPASSARLRFDREAALVKKLQHPNVVRLLDHGHTDSDQPFIAFELVAGRTLAALLRPGRGMDTPRIAAIGGQILDALVAAHALGIVHRDIKPANVMLEPGDRVRVLDFGLAKALFGNGDEVATITETGHRLGTPRYMSPEMARGHDAGPAGDVYAAALVIAEMVGGRPVIASNVQVDVMMEHASDRPLALDEAVQRSPFGALLARALAKDPAARPAAAAMREAMVEAVAIQARALALFGLEAPTGRDEATLVIAPDVAQNAPWATSDRGEVDGGRELEGARADHGNDRGTVTEEPAARRAGVRRRLAWALAAIVVVACALLVALV